MTDDEITWDDVLRDDDPALVALVGWLRKQTWSEFAQDLVDYYDENGTLSPKQIAAAEKMKAKLDAKADAENLDVPSGFYAVPGMDDEYDVFKVDRPTSGRWAGRVFIKTMAPNGEYENIAASEVTAVLHRIATIGPEEASDAYQQLRGSF